MPLLRYLAAVFLLAVGPLWTGAVAQEPAASGGGAVSEEPSDESPVPAAPAAAPAPAAMATPPASASSAGPDVFFLPDESGKLRRVLGYRYEDFLKAWQAGEQALDAVRRPKFTATEATLHLDVEQDAATVDAVVNVQLQSDGWVEVPLQLGSLITDAATVEGGGPTEFVRFAPDGQQYEAWLQGKPGDGRTIVLKGRVAVERQGAARRLALQLPGALIGKVTVNGPEGVELESPQDALTTTVAAGDGRATLSIEGAKGEVILRWGSAESDPTIAATALEAVVDGKISVEAGRLSHEAFIGVSGAETPIERFRVRLPTGATLSAPVEGEAYEIAAVASKGAGDRSIVEVRFRDPTTSPAVVRIAVEQPAPGAADPMLVEPFEVLGAFRQQGCLAVQVDDQLHAHFEQRGRIDQIEIAELPATVRNGAPLAGFSAAGNQWALAIHTQPRRRNVRVTPALQMHLGSQGATLDVQLDYQISGGRAFELRIDLEDWELTEQTIESGGAVDLAEQHITADQVLILPLKDADVQEVRLRFTLRREAGIGFHDLPLPEPQDAAVLPGSLTLTCDEGWQAVAQIENSMGVAPADESQPSAQPATDSTAAAAARPGRRAQRLQTFLPRVRLAVDVSELEQVVDVESVVDARVSGETIDVVQQLAYDIRNQPAAELAAAVSTQLLANEGLELSLDGSALPAASVDILPLTSDGIETQGRLRLVVRLPQPKLGKATLAIRSTVALDPQQLAGAANIVVPLATPEVPATVSASVRTVPGDRAASLAPGISTSWTVVTGEGGSQSAGPALLAVANEPVSELPLRMRAVESPGAAAADTSRILASWAQTWLAGGTRQDRFVYQFESTGARLTVQLPPSVGNASLEVLLDGQPATVDRAEEGRLVVPLPGDTARSTRRTLELRRLTPQQLGSWGQLAAGLPRLEGSGSGPFFWQVVLPRELTTLQTPGGTGAEYLLGWNGASWGRQPTQSQADLERWTGASKAPAPPKSANVYLYSAFAPPAELQVVVVRRLWLVVAAAAPLLALGLMWLHTSVGRSPRFLSVVFIVLAIFMAVYPEAAPPVVQAAVVGAVFTLISALTKWLLADVQIGGRPSATSTSSVISMAPTQAWAPENPPAPPSRPSAPSLHPSGSAR